MKRIVIFGGTFNPVHTEHINMVSAALKELNPDKLFIVPTFMPPHKNVQPASGTDRINMLKIAFAEEKRVEISDFEIASGGKSYSFITAEHFRSLYKDAEIYFMIGGDMLKDFKTWKNPSRILSAVNIAVFGREDYTLDYEKEREYFIKTFGKGFTLLNYVGKTISSTAIRTYIAFGLKPVGVPEKVYDYIVKNGVYSADKYQKYIIEHLTEKRIIHTANVVICALKRVKELGLDFEKVRIATTLHDCAKYDDPKNYKDFSIDPDVPPPVVHAFLGAYVAEEILGVSDKEIIDAIRYHTSGKPDMSLLGKLVFVADMVEDGRDYEGVDVLRALYEKDFEKCFTSCLKEEVLHLINKKQYIYSATLDAYDYYLGKNGQNNKEKL